MILLTCSKLVKLIIDMVKVNKMTTYSKPCYFLTYSKSAKNHYKKIFLSLYNIKNDKTKRY